MITYTWFYIICVAVFSVGFLYITKAQRNSFFNSIVSFVFVVYLILAVGYLFFPIRYDREFFGTVEELECINLIPFYTIISICKHTTLATSLTQIGGNILLFVPFGIVQVLYPSKKAFKKYIKCLICTIVCIEAIQLLSSLIIRVPNRIADVDDIILNSIGGVLGYCFWGRLQMLSSVFHKKENTKI